MQLQKHYIFLKGVDTATIMNGLESNELMIKDVDGVKINFVAANAKKCVRLCRFLGDPQVWKVTFADPVNECSQCDLKAGVKIRIRRNPTFDHETYLDTFGGRVFLYPFNPASGTTVTAEMVAAEMVTQINFSDGNTESLPVTAVIDPTDDASIIITSKHPDIPFDVYNLTDATPATIVEVHEGQPTVLDESAIAQMFPLQTGFAVIPGAGPDPSWQGCKNPCMITIYGCEPPTCGTGAIGGPWANSGHGYQAGNAPFTLVLVVNADDAGYGNFLTALETKIALTCTNQTPVAYNLTIGANQFTVSETNTTITIVDAGGGTSTGIVQYPGNITVKGTDGDHAGVVEVWDWNGTTGYTNPNTVFVTDDVVQFEWEPIVSTGGGNKKVDTVITVTFAA